MRALMQGLAAEHPLGRGGVTLIGMNRLSITKLLITLGLVGSPGIRIASTRGARMIMRHGELRRKRGSTRGSEMAILHEDPVAQLVEQRTFNP
jgi:hypothetical protein